MKKTLVALFYVFTISMALAQTPVKQSGASVTPNQVPWWVTSGVIGGGVSSADSPVTSFGVTNNGGNGICDNSDRITAAGRNTLCLGITTSGNGTISVQNYGTATAGTLCFIVNGLPICIGGTSGSGLVTTTLPTTTGAVTCWSNANGNLTNCSAGAATLFGNPASGSAVPAPFTIQGLTARGAPDATNDKIPLYDFASGTIKYVTPGLIAASATAGVSSFGAVTGAITLASEFTMSGQQLRLTVPPRGASVDLGGVNAAWVPPSPNLYHLFIPTNIKFNQGGLWASRVGTINAAFIPQNGANLVHLVSQVWATAGVKTAGSPTVASKWYKNAVVDGNFNIVSGQQVCAGIGSKSSLGDGTAIMRADCYDVPEDGDYYNLFMFIDSITLTVTSITIDGNEDHTYAQATVIY